MFSIHWHLDYQEKKWYREEKRERRDERWYSPAVARASWRNEAKGRSVPGLVRSASQSLQRDGGGPPCEVISESSAYLRNSPSSTLHVLQSPRAEQALSWSPKSQE